MQKNKQKTFRQGSGLSAACKKQAITSFLSWVLILIQTLVSEVEGEYVTTISSRPFTGF